MSKRYPCTCERNEKSEGPLATPLWVVWEPDVPRREDLRRHCKDSVQGSRRVTGTLRGQWRVKGYLPGPKDWSGRTCGGESDTWGDDVSPGRDQTETTHKDGGDSKTFSPGCEVCRDPLTTEATPVGPRHPPTTRHERNTLD